MSLSIGGLWRSALQTLSGQYAEGAAESVGATRPDAESREAAAPAPAAGGSSRAGPADQQRNSHSQRQQRLQDRLAEASQAPLPSAAAEGQQEAEQELPAVLTVTVCDKLGNPLAATFTEQHVRDFLGEMSTRELFEPLRLGQQGGITAADFYAACGSSVTGGRRVGFDFVVDEPPVHRLLRLELLAARAGRPSFAELLNPDQFNGFHYEKPSSALSNGAARLFAHLWRHGNQGRQQKVLCADLAAGHNGRTGASAGSLNNILLRVYKGEYNNDTPSKAPHKSLRAVEELPPAPPLDPLLEGQDQDAQRFAGAGFQQGQREFAAGPAVQAGLPPPPQWAPQGPYAQPADEQMAMLQAQLTTLATTSAALAAQVEELRARVTWLELAVPAGP